MDFLNTPGDTFGFLYNAYEIVRDDLGGRKEGAKKAAELAQVPLSELDTFYDNAHYQKLSGDKARHAGSIKRNEEPKTSRKMDLEGEARPLIRGVVLAWIDHKASRAGDPACFTDKT